MTTKVHKTIQRVQKQLRHVPSRTYTIVSVLAFATVGAVLLTSSHAATPTASYEAEAGTRSGNACTASDSGASSAQAVKFSAAACGGAGAGPLALDKTGQTIPDTDYDIPNGAVFMATSGNDTNNGTEAAPVKTLNRAFALIADGGTVVVRGGTYRDMYTGGGTAGYYKILTKGFTLQPYPHEKVWFDGTDVVNDGWSSDGAGHWKRAWSTPQFCDGKYYNFDPFNQPTDNTGPCSHYDVDSSPQKPTVGDPQAAWMNGAELEQVASLGSVTSTSFYYDWANKQLYIGRDPAGQTVELTARPTALVLGATSGRYIKGLGFKRYASNEYENLTSAALFIGGSGVSHVENSVFRDNGGNGISLSNQSGSSVKGNVFAYNGIRGMGSNGSGSRTGKLNDLLVEGNVFYHNNDKGFGYGCTVSCASAQIKMANMNGYTFRNNYLDTITNGSGIWCDTNCFDGVIVNNLIMNVAGGSGIFYEINDGGVVASNVIVNAKYGINAAGVNLKIYNNTIVNSATIHMRIFDDSRSQQTANMQVFNNLTYGNAVNVNWFANGGGQVGPDTFITGFDYNAYARTSTNTLYRWITSNDKSYNSNTAFRAALPEWEAHAIDSVGTSDPFFVNLAGGDYTVRADSAAYHSATTLPNDVAAALGLTEKNGYSRGAISWPGKP